MSYQAPNVESPTKASSAAVTVDLKDFFFVGFRYPFILLWKFLLMVSFPFRHVIDGFTQPVEDIHTSLPEYTRSVVQPDSVRAFELHRRNLKALASYYSRLSKHILEEQLRELEEVNSANPVDQIVGSSRDITPKEFKPRQHIPFSPQPILGSQQIFFEHLRKVSKALKPSEYNNFLKTIQKGSEDRQQGP